MQQQQNSQSNGQYQHAPAAFDFNRFNQHAKHLHAQVQYFNQQQQKILQSQINNVHKYGNGPQFDFVVNSNCSDLEKASEGRMADKQNIAPKVIKITKTVAVKQPMAVPYPVPVVKYIKEQSPNIPQHASAPTEYNSVFTPSSYFNYTSYAGKHPTQSLLNVKNTESYHHQTEQASEYDTRPFYVKNSDKEIIKYIPVPYYVDENGTKVPAVSMPAESSYHSNNDIPSFYPSQKTLSSSDSAGKFETLTFSYHPPAPIAIQHHHHHHAQPQSVQPEKKYYYSHEPENTATSDPTHHHYTASEQQHNDNEDDAQQHYQYKYVTYE